MANVMDDIVQSLADSHGIIRSYKPVGYRTELVYDHALPTTVIAAWTRLELESEDREVPNEVIYLEGDAWHNIKRVIEKAAEESDCKVSL